MANENVLNEARMIISGFLKNRRIELNLSQQDLADRVGMARETISRMEAGKFWLVMKQYLQICEALHLFPAVAEMESKTDIAEALRKNWIPNQKAMSIEEALKLKADRYNREGSSN